MKPPNSPNPNAKANPKTQDKTTTAFRLKVTFGPLSPQQIVFRNNFSGAGIDYSGNRLQETLNPTKLLRQHLSIILRSGLEVPHIGVNVFRVRTGPVYARSLVSQQLAKTSSSKFEVPFTPFRTAVPFGDKITWN